MTNQKAYFFDMDGVLFDSMPHHAVAWEEVMKAHNLSFTARDCYINEGRTGESIIREAMLKERHREATPDEINLIYGEKSARFHVLADQVGGKSGRICSKSLSRTKPTTQNSRSWGVAAICSAT